MCLDPLRNKLSFHFDREELLQGIDSLGDGPFTLMRGLGTTNAEFHYELADDAALSYLVHLEEFEDLKERIEEVIGPTTEFLVAFLVASDDLVGEIANAWGMEIEDA